MVLGSCACCAGMLPFWVICVVYVWRWLCGLVLCIQTTCLNTKLSEYEVWCKRPTCRTRCHATFFAGALCMAAKTKNETNDLRQNVRLWRQLRRLSMPPGTRSRGRPRSRSPADDAAAQRRRADGGEREDEDESEDEDVVQPATTIAGERAAGHGGSGVAATA